MFSQKEITDKEHESNQTEAKPDWFLKACGGGMILLGLCGLDQYPIYALILVVVGIAACFAAHGAPPSME